MKSKRTFCFCYSKFVIFWKAIGNKGEMRRSYRKFDHQSIHDAADDGDEVKGIPRVFEVTLHCHSYVVRQGSSTVYLRDGEKVNKELVSILHNGSKKSANLNVKDAKKSI